MHFSAPRDQVIAMERAMQGPEQIRICDLNLYQIGYGEPSNDNARVEVTAFLTAIPQSRRTRSSSMGVEVDGKPLQVIQYHD